MSARSKARKRAVDILFSADVRQTPVVEALAAAARRADSEPDRASSWRYASEVVQGYVDHADVIDEMISSYARGWPLTRMPAVDRSILRVATWELLYNRGVPSSVAIAEAVQLASELSTEESAPFVNGVLAAVAQSQS